MSDEIDEWALEMRLACDRARAEGKTTITITTTVAAFTTLVDIAQGYFRDTSRTCFMCGAIRTNNALAERLKDWRHKQEREIDWRRNARPLHDKRRK